MADKPLTDKQQLWRYRVFAATWMSYAGFYLCRKAYGVLKSSLERDLGLTTTELAHIWTVYLIAYMLGQFISGALGRRTGPRVLLLLGMAISAGCNVVFSHANEFGTFFGFMILNGFAQSTGWPGNVGAMAQWFRKSERGTIMAVWSTCYQLGSVIAKAFATFLLGAYGWRWSFWGASIALGVVWLLFLLLQRNRPEDAGLDPIVTDAEPETKTTTKDGVATTLERPRDSFFAILKNPLVLAMGGAYFSIKFLRYAVDSWLPYFLDVVYGTSAVAGGYASTVFDLAGFVGAIFAGTISDRFFGGRRAPVMVLMSGGMTIAYLLVFQLGGTSIATLVSLYGLIGFMLYGPDTLLAGAGAIDVSSKRGAVAAAGIINGLGSIGPIVQEQLIAYLFESSGGRIGPINILLVAVSILATLTITYIWYRGRSDKNRSV